MKQTELCRQINIPSIFGDQPCNRANYYFSEQCLRQILALYNGLCISALALRQENTVDHLTAKI